MPEEIYLMIILIIGWVTAIVFEFRCNRWHRKHDDAVSMRAIESWRKDKQIEKLENEIKTYKDMERVVKIEKVVVEPKEYTCKFPVNSEYIDDTELFKKICLGEVSRYMAEEFEKNPYMYKLYFEKNPVQMTETITIRFRLLPYPEEAVQFNNLELGRPALGMAWDKLRYK